MRVMKLGLASIVVVAIAILSTAASCGGGHEPTPDQAVETKDVERLRDDDLLVRETRPLESQSEEQRIHIDNCDGAADVTRVTKRSHEVELVTEAQLELEGPVLKAGVLRHYGKQRGAEESLSLTAPPGRDMVFVIRWTVRTYEGSIVSAMLARPATYRYIAPVGVEIVSQADTGRCATQTGVSGQTPGNPEPEQDDDGGSFSPASSAEAASLFGGPNAGDWQACPGEPTGCWMFRLPGNGYRVEVPKNCLNSAGSIDGWRVDGGYPEEADAVEDGTRVWHSLEGATIRCR